MEADGTLYLRPSELISCMPSLPGQLLKVYKSKEVLRTALTGLASQCYEKQVGQTEGGCTVDSVFGITPAVRKVEVDVIYTADNLWILPTGQRGCQGLYESRSVQ